MLPCCHRGGNQLHYDDVCICATAFDYRRQANAHADILCCMPVIADDKLKKRGSNLGDGPQSFMQRAILEPYKSMLSKKACQGALMFLLFGLLVLSGYGVSKLRWASSKRTLPKRGLRSMNFSTHVSTTFSMYPIYLVTGKGDYSDRRGRRHSSISATTLKNAPMFLAILLIPPTLPRGLRRFICIWETAKAASLC